MAGHPDTDLSEREESARPWLARVAFDDFLHAMSPRHYPRSFVQMTGGDLAGRCTKSLSALYYDKVPKAKVFGPLLKKRNSRCLSQKTPYHAG